MPKSSTIRKWSNARRARVFINQTAKDTSTLMGSVSIDDVDLHIDVQRKAALSRKIAEKILSRYQDSSFLEAAAKFSADEKPQDVSSLKIIEDHVLSSERLREIIKD